MDVTLDQILYWNWCCIFHQLSFVYGYASHRPILPEFCGNTLICATSQVSQKITDMMSAFINMAPFHAVTVFHLVTQGTVAECLNSTKTSPGIKHTSIALICCRQDRPGSAIKSFFFTFPGLGDAWGPQDFTNSGQVQKCLGTGNAASGKW